MTETAVLSLKDWLLIGGVVVALIASIVTLMRMMRMEKQNAALFHQADGRKVEQLLSECIAHVGSVRENNRTLQDGLAHAHRLLEERVVRPVFKRYNSFDDVGGSQSFSVVLVDQTGTGVIISSLHSRQGAAMYAKWVERGTPQHNLSDEEQEILDEALGMGRHG